MKRENAAKKACAERSLVASKCIALVEKHTNMHTYPFVTKHARPVKFRILKGPAKSTPVFKKGLVNCVRSGGRDDMIWFWVCRLYSTQGLQRFITIFTRGLSRKIQNSDRRVGFPHVMYIYEYVQLEGMKDSNSVAAELDVFRYELT